MHGSSSWRVSAVAGEGQGGESRKTLCAEERQLEPQAGKGNTVRKKTVPVTSLSLALCVREGDPGGGDAPPPVCSSRGCRCEGEGVWDVLE